MSLWIILIDRLILWFPAHTPEGRFTGRMEFTVEHTHSQVITSAGDWLADSDRTPPLVVTRSNNRIN